MSQGNAWTFCNTECSFHCSEEPLFVCLCYITTRLLFWKTWQLVKIGSRETPTVRIRASLQPQTLFLKWSTTGLPDVAAQQRRRPSQITLTMKTLASLVVTITSWVLLHCPGALSRKGPLCSSQRCLCPFRGALQWVHHQWAHKCITTTPSVGIKCKISHGPSRLL